MNNARISRALNIATDLAKEQIAAGQNAAQVYETLHARTLAGGMDPEVSHLLCRAARRIAFNKNTHEKELERLGHLLGYVPNLCEVLGVGLYAS